MKFDTLFPE